MGAAQTKTKQHVWHKTLPAGAIKVAEAAEKRRLKNEPHRLPSGRLGQILTLSEMGDFLINPYSIGERPNMYAIISRVAPEGTAADHPEMCAYQEPVAVSVEDINEMSTSHDVASHLAISLNVAANYKDPTEAMSGTAKATTGYDITASENVQAFVVDKKDGTHRVVVRKGKLDGTGANCEAENINPSIWEVLYELNDTLPEKYSDGKAIYDKYIDFLHFWGSFVIDSVMYGTRFQMWKSQTSSERTDMKFLKAAMCAGYAEGGENAPSGGGQPPVPSVGYACTGTGYCEPSSNHTETKDECESKCAYSESTLVDGGFRRFSKLYAPTPTTPTADFSGCADMDQTTTEALKGKQINSRTIVFGGNVADRNQIIKDGYSKANMETFSNAAELHQPEMIDFTLEPMVTILSRAVGVLSSAVAPPDPSGGGGGGGGGGGDDGGMYSCKGGTNCVSDPSSDLTYADCQSIGCDSRALAAHHMTTTTPTIEDLALRSIINNRRRRARKLSDNPLPYWTRMKYIVENLARVTYMEQGTVECMTGTGKDRDCHRRSIEDPIQNPDQKQKLYATMKECNGRYCSGSGAECDPWAATDTCMATNAGGRCMKGCAHNGCHADSDCTWYSVAGIETPLAHCTGPGCMWANEVSADGGIGDAFKKASCTCKGGFGQGKAKCCINSVKPDSDLTFCYSATC